MGFASIVKLEAKGKGDAQPPHAADPFRRASPAYTGR